MSGYWTNQMPICKKLVRVVHFTRFERDGRYWVRAHTDCDESGEWALSDDFNKQLGPERLQSWRCFTTHFGYVELVKKIIDD